MGTGSTLKLIINGKPIAKKRPRFARRGKYVAVINDQETEEGKFLHEIKRHLNGYSPAQGPVSLNLIFVMPTTKGWPKYKLRALKGDKVIWHEKKPDLDNLVKFCLDCLNGIVFMDDSQIVSLNARKYYGLVPKTVIDVREME